MSARRWSVLALAGLAGCVPRPAPVLVVVPEPARPLPALPAMQIASTVASAPAATGALARDANEKRISLTATNADVRSLLVAIASQGNVNLVLSPDVEGRVSVVLHDVPVSEALRRVMAEAGLGVTAKTGITMPHDPATVFYQLPVNVDRLTVEGIMSHYGVGRAVAELIVDSRPSRMP